MITRRKTATLCLLLFFALFAIWQLRRSIFNYYIPLIPITRYPNFRQAYTEFQQNYTARLSQLPKPHYTKSDVFTEIGPPIRSVLRELKKTNWTGTKTVLLWTSFYGEKNWIPQNLCPPTSNLTCHVTADRNDILKSDAVIFHPVDLYDDPRLPTKRLPNQRWVYFIQEPPYLAYMKFKEYNGVFNWTATYRRDSDFPAVLYQSAKLNKPLSLETYTHLLGEIMSEKKKRVAIMHRNCHPRSRRFEILNELRQFMRVDFYGYCGDLTCARATEACRHTMSQYKFYLAFENSNCREYITEKVWNPLHSWNAVPIVFGAPEQDYKAALPPDSYIYVEGFSSVRKLAEYIILLDENPEMYETYHAWRRTHTAGHFSTYCDMCKALHNDSMPVKIYSDFQGWYEEDVCSA